METTDSAPRSSLASLDRSSNAFEAPQASWSKRTLLIAYLGLYLLAYVTSLEAQVTLNLAVFATSAFSAHSLVSTVFVVQAVIFSVVKPLMAKVAHVFGRFEAFTLCVLLMTTGYITQAKSGSLGTYTASSISYSAGATGLQILQQIFIADTSSLNNRAILSTIPDVPFLINVWIGSPIASSLLNGPGWRWGYGVWAVILPLCYLPLAVSLIVEKWNLQRQSMKTTIVRPTPMRLAVNLWYELDAFGLGLLSTAIALILVPLTLAKNVEGTWSNKGIIASLLFGLGCLVAFPLWERNPRLAPHPFFPPHLLLNRTVLAGLSIPFFFCVAYYLSVIPYFQSYLLVVYGLSITTAGQIVQIYVFGSTITAIGVSLLIKATHRYKRYVFFGACTYLLGAILTAMFRTKGGSLWAVAATQVVIGIGGGLMVVPAQLGVQACVGKEDVATTTALFLMALEVGGAVGSAISGAIWTNNILPKLQLYLPPETVDQASVIYGNISLASNGWPVGDATREAIERAYQETMAKMLIAAVCACVPLVPFSLMMKNLKLDEMDLGREVSDPIGVGEQELSEFEERAPLAGIRRGSWSDEDDALDPQPKHGILRKDT